MDEKFFNKNFLVSNYLRRRWESASKSDKNIFFRFFSWIFEKTSFDIYATNHDSGVIFFGVYGNVRAGHRLGWARMDAGGIKVRLKSKLYKGIIPKSELRMMGGIETEDDKGFFHYDYLLNSRNMGSITAVIKKCVEGHDYSGLDPAERMLPWMSILDEDFEPAALGGEPMVLSGGEVEVVAKMRIGQRGFRRALLKRWGGCAVTGVKEKKLLIASHVKPWSKCSNADKVDPDNGLLLTPALDKAFDTLLITFDEKGSIVFRKRHARVLEAAGIRPVMKLRVMPNARQKEFMSFHRAAYKAARTS